MTGGRDLLLIHPPTPGRPPVAETFQKSRVTTTRRARAEMFAKTEIELREAPARSADIKTYDGVILCRICIRR